MVAVCQVRSWRLASLTTNSLVQHHLQSARVFLLGTFCFIVQSVCHHFKINSRSPTYNRNMAFVFLTQVCTTIQFSHPLSVVCSFASHHYFMKTKFPEQFSKSKEIFPAKSHQHQSVKGYRVAHDKKHTHSKLATF